MFQKMKDTVIIVLYAVLLRYSSCEIDEVLRNFEGISEPEEPIHKSPEERPEYKLPVARGRVYFSEAFESDAAFRNRWVFSRGTTSSGEKYDGSLTIEEPLDNPLRGDLGLRLTSNSKFHAVSAKLSQTFEFAKRPLIVQYEVRFQKPQDCGGAYIKLLGSAKMLDLELFNDTTPYIIMFGPDKCGLSGKLHFIFTHRNPHTGVYEEKHASQPPNGMGSLFSDKKTHLYTLVVRPENTFEIFIDQESVHSGSLLSDMTPPVNPPKKKKVPTATLR